MDFSFLQANWWLLGLILWEVVWKGLAMWKAARLGQKYWFAALLVINTAGILPIAYLIFHYNKEQRVHWVGHNL